VIYNIRGPNGSGKSTIARALRGADFREVVLINASAPIPKDLYVNRETGVTYRKKTGKPYTPPAPYAVPGYINNQTGVGVVGKYETDCGGCDGIKSQDAVVDAVWAMVEQAPDTVFEGVLVTTIFDRYLTMAREAQRRREGFTWVFLHTPLKVCLERIQLRNGGKPIKEDLVADKIKSMMSVRHKVRQLPDQVYLDLDSADPFTQLAEYMAKQRMERPE